MTLMTPLTALAPQRVAPGPLMTSIRSMSARGSSCTSQNTPEYNGVYTVRPSMSTRSLLAVVLLNPRALMAQSRELTCATCKLVARRRASGRLEAPERRMSCWVMTWMAEATCANLSGRLETEVTSRFISCSMLSFFNAAADALESGCWANPGSAKQTRPNVRSISVAAATVLGSAIGRYPLVYRASCYDCAPGRAPWLALAVARDGPFPHKLPFSPGAVVIRVTRPTAAPGGGQRIGPQDAGPLGKC